MKVEVCGPSDPQWDEALLDIPHDFYHRCAYHAFEEANGEGAAHAVVITDGAKKMVFPYLLKEALLPGSATATGFFEVRSAYGYPGPVYSNACDQNFFVESFEELLRLWRDQQVVNIFARLHPVLANHEPLLELNRTGVLKSHQPCASEALICHGKTVSVDLTLDAEARQAGYSATVRKGLRRNRNAGVTTAHDIDFRHLRDFYNFYVATMTRNRASAYYYFSYEYFERLVRHSPGAVELLVTKQNDVPVCAALISVCAKQLQALFIMANPEFTAMSPSRTLIDDVCQWGRARGASDFHLGGGRGGAKDSLFEFKASFSNVHRDFYTLRLVTNRAAYEQLVQDRVSIGPLDDADQFFPAWRKPLPVADLVGTACTNGRVGA